MCVVRGTGWLVGHQPASQPNSSLLLILHLPHLGLIQIAYILFNICVMELMLNVRISH